MKKYFLVEGLDEGEPIEPYVVETEHRRPYWLDEMGGDASRTYRQITEEEIGLFLATSATLIHRVISPEVQAKHEYKNDLLDDIMKEEAEDLMTAEEYDQYAIDDVIDSMPELVADVLTETKEPVPAEIDVVKSRKDLIVMCVKVLFDVPRAVSVYEHDHTLDPGMTIKTSKVYVTRVNEYGQWDTEFYYQDGKLLSVTGADVSIFDIDRMRDLFECSELSS